MVKTTILILLISFIFITLAGFLTLFVITRRVKIDNGELSKHSPNLVLETFDNEKIDYLTMKNKFTPFEEISPNIINAFVALEDKRFFNHHGLDYYRLAGALINDIKAGYFKEGGSTITQQLAKNTLLSNEKTFKRKLYEAKLAIDIEKNYSKEDIIEMYLNAIYFGNGLYGITAATEKLFSKSPKDATPAEGATLAAIVNNPKRNSPLNGLDNSEKRKNLVLKLMKEQNMLDENQYSEALAYKFDMNEVSNKRYNYSYTNSVIEEASKILNINEKDLLNKNYVITTYMDNKKQKSLEALFNSNEFLPDDKISYSALVGDNKHTGVSAYVANYDNSIFNLRRNPASTIKPFISYAPALEANYIYPDGMVLDEKTDFNGYSPSNYGDSYLGWTDYRTALTKSQNIPSVKLVNELSVNYCKNVARNCGMNFSDEDNNLSVALGGLHKGSTMLELAQSYMTLANQGEFSKLTFIKEIRTKDNQLLYSHKKSNFKAISKENAYLLTDMLIDTVKFGTASKLSYLPYTIAAKTGTNAFNKHKNNDAWNLSYTSDSTVCVWYGNLSNKEENALPNNITGGSYPTLLAKNIYSSLPKPSDFEVPDAIMECEVDSYTSLEKKELYLASDYTPEYYRKKCLFNINNMPKLISTTFDILAPDDFVTENRNGGINIKFYARENMTYRIYAYPLFGTPTLVRTVNADQSGILEELFNIDALGIVKVYIEVSDKENNFTLKTNEKTMFINSFNNMFDF